MPRAGSMRDPEARRAAGHSTSDDAEVETGTEDRGQRRPARRARQRPTSSDDRDREVLTGAPEEADVIDPDSDTGATEEDRRRAARKPRKAKDSDEEDFYEYRGRKFRSQEELDDYLDDLEADRRRAQQPPREKPARQQKQEPEIPWDKLIEDTPGVMKTFADSMIQRIRDELIPAYQADRDMREFWGSFYQENPELNKPKLKMLIESIFMSSQDKIGDLPLDRARARLGRIVKAELREMGIPLQGAGGFSEEEEQEEGIQVRRSRTRVEGGSTGDSGRRRERRNEGEEQVVRQPNGNPVTLTAVLRARAARRRGEDTSSFFK